MINFLDNIVLFIFDSGLILFSFIVLWLLAAVYGAAIVLTLFAYTRKLYRSWKYVSNVFIDSVVNFQYWTEMDFLKDRDREE